MNGKLKAALGAAGLALLVGGAVLAYNALSGWVGFADRLALPAEPGEAGPDAPSAPRQRAPDFAMTDWRGDGVRLSEILAGGRPVVLNFWASWCPACRAEKPGFESVYREFGAEVKFVMLCLVDGARETVESGRRHIEAGGFTLPVYFDTAREGMLAYGIRGIPATVFIGADGYVVAAAQGALDEGSLRMAVDFLLR